MRLAVGLRGETLVYLEKVRLRVGDQVHPIDTRPSDALNLAIRAKCPILINDAVIKAMLEKHGEAD